MDQEELRRKLMGLWEKTTHSSKTLVGSLFNYYFNPKYIEYKEQDGKIVSAVLGIPYVFGYGRKFLNGLYLISITSEDGFQRKGVISELLNNINERVSNEFDFTFIVPHTELMSDYYSSQGYFNSFFILEERYTSLHDFKNDYFLTLYDSDNRIKELKMALMDEIKVVNNSIERQFSKQDITNFIESIEGKSVAAVNLRHTPNDILYLLDEESIRNLEPFIAYDSDHNITGVAFSQKEDLNRIKVVAIYSEDICSYFALLDYVKHQYLDFSLSVNSFDSNSQVHSLIQQVYAASNPAGGDLDNTFETFYQPFNLNRLLQPLGMVKILRFDNILKYIADTRSDADFKLYIRDYKHSDGEDNTKKVYFKVKNGKFFQDEYLYNSHSSSILCLSEKEVSELLLRKNDSSNLIMEAFGIPRLNLQLSLLPC